MSHPHLPYTDTKAEGAPDFYFAINATFRFLIRKLGHEGWVRYLRHLGTGYFRPVNDAWRAGGFPAIAGYWRDFFAAEPGADITVRESDTGVSVEVHRCPAIHHLRDHGREIVPEYCQHCFHLGESRAAAAGYAFRLEGGDGNCRHHYTRPEDAVPQTMEAIREVRSC